MPLPLGTALGWEAGHPGGAPAVGWGQDLISSSECPGAHWKSKVSAGRLRSDLATTKAAGDGRAWSSEHIGTTGGLFTLACAQDPAVAQPPLLFREQGHIWRPWILWVGGLGCGAVWTHFERRTGRSILGCHGSQVLPHPAPRVLLGER